jgi:hypothetical protein
MHVYKEGSDYSKSDKFITSVFCHYFQYNIIIIAIKNIWIER